MNCLNKKQSQNKINNIIRQKTVEEMKTYQLETEALWLRAVMKEFGFGAQRLERLYKAFYDLRKNDQYFYDTDGYDSEDVIPTGAINELHDAGIDIKEWFEKYGEMIVDTRFSDGK